MLKSKIEKVLRRIQGEKSSKDTASSKNLVSTIEAEASPKRGTEPGVRKGKSSLLASHTRCKCSTSTTRNSVKVKSGEVKSLLNLKVDSYGPKTDFRYICTVTLTLETVMIFGQGHDTPLSHGQQLFEVLSRSNLAVRSHDPDTDFRYVCTMTSTSADRQCGSYMGDSQKMSKFM